MDESPNSKGKPGEPHRRATPRWVKGFGIAATLLLGLFVTLHLTGHGMGAHMHGMSGIR